MIEAVFVFGLLNLVFEYIVLGMMPPRARLRVLGSQGLSSCMHFGMLGINLTVHWGTLIGSMGAIVAFCASLVTLNVAKRHFGYITGRTYTPGWVRYDWRALA